jgi:hypothetical protein
MSRTIFILAVVGTVVAAARPSLAYDGSGGAKLAALLERVEFAQGGGTEFDPPLFEWTDAKRQEVKDALSSVLTQMPLDLSDLPEIRHLSVSNARCSVPPDRGRLEDDPEFKSGAQDMRKAHYLYFCGADTATYYPATHSVAISGTIYELSRESTDEGRKLLARVLQHELTHAWEKDSETKEFYALGYVRRDKDWFRVLSQHDKIYQKALKRADKADEERRPAEQKRLSDLRALIRVCQEADFQTLGFPGRFGGSTGRVDPRAEAGTDPIDTHSMETRHEYLAILSELLWVDPPLAHRQYSRGEIDWVENHAFKNRPITAFNADAAPEEPRQSSLDEARVRAVRRDASEMAQSIGR